MSGLLLLWIQPAMLCCACACAKKHATSIQTEWLSSRTEAGSLQAHVCPGVGRRQVAAVRGQRLWHKWHGSMKRSEMPGHRARMGCHHRKHNGRSARACCVLATSPIYDEAQS